MSEIISDLKTYAIEWVARHATALAVGNGYDAENSSDPDWDVHVSVRNTLAHAHVSAEITYDHGRDDAEHAEDVKERFDNSSPADERKDRFNNEVGRRIAEYAKANNLDKDDIDALIMDALNSGHLALNDPGTAQPTWVAPTQGWPGSSLGRNYNHNIEGADTSEVFLPMPWLDGIPDTFGESPQAQNTSFPPLPAHKPEIPGDVTGALSPILNLPGVGPINFQSLGRTDPLVIDLDNDGVELVSAANSGVRFDFSGDGFATATGWVGAGDGFLVRDLDADGKIENVGEMFGAPHSLTYIVGSDWEAFMNEENGFAKLAALDSNSDGKIDGNDAAWGELKVWKDTNQDGVSQATELHTLSTLGIAGIDVANYALPRREARSVAERVRQLLLESLLIYRGADGAAIAHSVAVNDNRCFGKRFHLRRAEAVAA